MIKTLTPLAFLLLFIHVHLFSQPSDLENTKLTLEYYGEIGCAHCDLFAEKILPSAVRESGVEVEPEYFDILSSEGYERCERELGKRGIEFTIFPVMIIGNNVYQGNDAVEKNLLSELKFYANHNTFQPHISPDIKKTSDIMNTSILGVITAGLIDGINPCAFATMLFFISWIGIRGGGKQRILLSGLTFIAGVYITYLAIGFGLFGILRQASGLILIRSVVRWAFGLAAVVFAFLSLIDAVSAVRGKSERIILQLSKNTKKRIHRVIRLGRSKKNTGFSVLLLPGILLSGVIVAFLELACTGQIYFPTIAYMVQTAESPGSEILLLQLYNIAFIIPLLAVLFLAAVGVEQKGLQLWFTRNLAMGKFITAIFFFLLAFMILRGWNSF